MQSIDLAAELRLQMFFRQLRRTLGHLRRQLQDQIAPAHEGEWDYRSPFQFHW
jgi:hypothetical protein